MDALQRLNGGVARVLPTSDNAILLMGIQLPREWSLHARAFAVVVDSRPPHMHMLSLVVFGKELELIGCIRILRIVPHVVQGNSGRGNLHAPARTGRTRERRRVVRIGL